VSICQGIEVVGKNWTRNGGVLNEERCPKHAENSTPPSRRQWPLKLPRATFCYRPVASSEQDLAAMRTLDELYQEDATRGTRRMSSELQKQGFSIE